MTQSHEVDNNVTVILAQYLKIQNIYKINFTISPLCVISPIKIALFTLGYFLRELLF